MIRSIACIVTSIALLAPATAFAQTKAPAPSPEAALALEDIQRTLGVVPTFMKKGIPEQGLASAWQMMKAIELDPNKALPDKYVSLISFAVASQIPCRYCIIADREFAKVGGATEEELNEAVAIASITRFWSTWLNGNRFDEVQFRKEADQIFAYVKKPPASPMPQVTVIDAATAMKDIQATLGTVPTFMKAMPDMALAPAWLQMKQVQLSPSTAIAPRYKELIGLAVAAQIPCHYCAYFHLNAAKLNGATEAEVKGAIAEASLTRYFSTVLNGYGQDEGSFRREIQAAVRAMKKQMHLSSASPVPARVDGVASR